MADADLLDDDQSHEGGKPEGLGADGAGRSEAAGEGDPDADPGDGAAEQEVGDAEAAALGAAASDGDLQQSYSDNDAGGVGASGGAPVGSGDEESLTEPALPDPDAEADGGEPAADASSAAGSGVGDEAAVPSAAADAEGTDGAKEAPAAGDDDAAVAAAGGDDGGEELGAVAGDEAAYARSAAGDADPDDTSAAGDGVADAGGGDAGGERDEGVAGGSEDAGPGNPAAEEEASGLLWQQSDGGAQGDGPHTDESLSYKPLYGGALSTSGSEAPATAARAQATGPPPPLELAPGLAAAWLTFARRAPASQGSYTAGSAGGGSRPASGLAVLRSGSTAAAQQPATMGSQGSFKAAASQGTITAASAASGSRPGSRLAPLRRDSFQPPAVEASQGSVAAASVAAPSTRPGSGVPAAEGSGRSVTAASVSADSRPGSAAGSVAAIRSRPHSNSGSVRPGSAAESQPPAAERTVRARPDLTARLRPKAQPWRAVKPPSPRPLLPLARGGPAPQAQSPPPKRRRPNAGAAAEASGASVTATPTAVAGSRPGSGAPGSKAAEQPARPPSVLESPTPHPDPDAASAYDAPSDDAAFVAKSYHELLAEAATADAAADNDPAAADAPEGDAHAAGAGADATAGADSSADADADPAAGADAEAEADAGTAAESRPASQAASSRPDSAAATAAAFMAARGYPRTTARANPAASGLRRLYEQLLAAAKGDDASRGKRSEAALSYGLEGGPLAMPLSVGQKQVARIHPLSGMFTQFEYVPSEYDRTKLKGKFDRLRHKLSQTAPNDFVVRSSPYAVRGTPAFSEYTYTPDPVESLDSSLRANEDMLRSKVVAGPFYPSGRVHQMTALKGRLDECMMGLCRQMSADWPQGFLQIFEDGNGSVVASFDKGRAVAEGDLSAYMNTLAKRHPLVAAFQLGKDATQYLGPHAAAAFGEGANGRPGSRGSGSSMSEDGERGAAEAEEVGVPYGAPAMAVGMGSLAGGGGAELFRSASGVGR
ncbi:hypothetical protein TSOC_002837 [Tetrabaena socialis]|uniref:Uncharacterized protein n=1 Tax=Tetrabaena socialis TaxID=47790 RepID=A0A2J8AD45_9CHLO|nr:hypothetical protein TSOC_002837 [Tetrabaena socialis]|eukprot:PNH10444.1 hypothetical protein TSOC_002837 [Tetrabaena socialis]